MIMRLESIQSTDTERGSALRIEHSGKETSASSLHLLHIPSMGDVEQLCLIRQNEFRYLIMEKSRMISSLHCHCLKFA